MSSLSRSEAQIGSNKDTQTHTDNLSHRCVISQTDGITLRSGLKTFKKFLSLLSRYVFIFNVVHKG